MTKKIAGELEYLGWIDCYDENDNLVIMKDDEMAVFKDDSEAVKFLVDSYNELLKACKGILPLGDLFEDDLHWGDDFVRIQRAINNAEKYLQKEKV